MDPVTKFMWGYPWNLPEAQEEEVERHIYKCPKCKGEREFKPEDVVKDGVHCLPCQVDCEKIGTTKD